MWEHWPFSPDFVAKCDSPQLHHYRPFSTILRLPLWVSVKLLSVAGLAVATVPAAGTDEVSCAAAGVVC